MSDKANKRSGMLGTIYKMLPNVDDDYAAKLVYTLENKKTLPALQQDIADIAAQLGETQNAMSDTIVAKILLDEITLPAALRQLRVYNNALSISELAEALETPAEENDLLLNCYASFGSRYFFDVQFAEALRDVRNDPSLSDSEKAHYALDKLLEQAKKEINENKDIPDENKKAIYEVADRYHLSLTITAALLAIYAVPGTVPFQEYFNNLLSLLQQINDDERLNASLAAKTLLCQISQRDAQNITLTSKLLKGQVLEEDLMIIACRYLKTKTPKDILDAFEAVLQRLPHVRQKEENLGLAVRVLLDGTEPTFEKAQQKAALHRERILLSKALAQTDLFAGYEQDLSEHFAGQKTLEELQEQARQILADLPYCQDPLENKELACKVLLGTLGTEEAKTQAAYLQDLKAKTLTKGLAPRVLKNYLGTKPAEELTAFFEKALAPYTFWKSDRNAHEFALQALVGELNGTSNAHISKFVLDMLESGSSLELVGDMLANIQSHKTSKQELDKLLAMYQKACASSTES